MADAELPPVPSVPAGYFQDLYRRAPDPWQFATSAYERAKYEATLAALPRGRYEHALEIGCSIGVFTAMLAQRCARLLAVDVSDVALESARERCANAPHVRFALVDVPHDFPAGRFDLVTLCEVGYYWNAADLRRARDRILAAALPQAHIMLVHWLPRVEGHASDTDAVHAAFEKARCLRRIFGARNERYRLDLFEKK